MYFKFYYRLGTCTSKTAQQAFINSIINISYSEWCMDSLIIRLNLIIAKNNNIKQNSDYTQKKLG